MRKLFYAGVMMALAACAQMGNQEIKNDGKVSEIRPGITKKGEVRTTVGEPSKITFTDTGEEGWDYKLESYQATPQQFIPFFGPLFAGDVEEHTLTIRFRPDGVVKEVGKGRRTGTGGL